VSGKIVRKLALYQGQWRMAAHSIPAGFISAAAGGYDPAIQKRLTKVPKISNAPEGRPQSGNRSSMQRKIQSISIKISAPIHTHGSADHNDGDDHILPVEVTYGYETRLL
jgi:hypothetical protein